MSLLLLNCKLLSGEPAAPARQAKGGGGGEGICVCPCCFSIENLSQMNQLLWRGKRKVVGGDIRGTSCLQFSCKLKLTNWTEGKGFKDHICEETPPFLEASHTFQPFMLGNTLPPRQDHTSHSSCCAGSAPEF